MAQEETTDKIILKIKESYWNQDVEIIKKELNYISGFLHENYINLELKLVEEYEKLIKILSTVLLEKMKEKLIPQNGEGRVLTFNPLGVGSMTQKLLYYNANRKKMDITELIQSYGTLTKIQCDQFAIHALIEFAKYKHIKLSYPLHKDELITKIVLSQPIESE